MKIRESYALAAFVGLSARLGAFDDISAVVLPDEFFSAADGPSEKWSTGMVKGWVWMLPALLAAAAGWSDWRFRRIPNWLTVPGLVLGVAVNSLVWGWPGAKASLLGALLGLVLLLPFVLVRSLGAGDWKLVGALGAFLGPQHLIAVLFGAVLVAGVMAAVLVIWHKRVRQTVHNLGRMLAAFFTLHLPGSELSLDNPEALKVPFGVAVAVAVILYSAGQVWRVLQG